MKTSRKMKRWKKLLKLRKQNDAVKIVFLFLLLGIGLAADAVYHGTLLYRQMKKPAEYVLTKDISAAELNKELVEIKKREDISAASLYQEVNLTIKYKEKETSFPCIELSKAYLKDAYHISESGATKTFYMNQKAFEQIEGGSVYEEASVPDRKSRDKRLLVTYETVNPVTAGDIAGDRSGEKGAGKAKTAEIVLIRENIPREEPFVFCMGERPDIEKNTAGIRVFARRQDLDESNAEKFQSSGFTIENIARHQKTQFLQKTREIRIGYNLLAGALCFFSARALWKLVRHGMIKEN